MRWAGYVFQREQVFSNEHGNKEARRKKIIRKMQAQIVGSVEVIMHMEGWRVLVDVAKS